MAPLLRRALGSFKDQTSIGIAKVGSSGTPELDILLVKATSHDESPVDERHVQEIIHLTSFSQGYVNACVAGIAKRLGKTHNWVVAIKGLMLTHRLLREGDSSFEQEFLYHSRHGMRVLNLSNFRDDSYSHAWDYSAFVRTYALFLDEKLEFNLEIAKGQPEDGGRRGGSSRDGRDRHRDDGSDHHRNRDDGYGYDSRRDDGYGYDSRRDDGDGYDRRRDDGDGYDRRRDDSYGYDRRREDGYGGEPRRYDEYGPSKRDDDSSRSRNSHRENGYGKDARDQGRKAISIKDMTAKDLLGRIPPMQRMLDHILACRPTGAARMNRLVQIALYPVVRESFLLYTDICDGLAIVMDAFFEMDHRDCVKAFDIYSKGAKQIDELTSFYNACKDYGVCRASEFPTVQKMSEDVLETMEDFLRDRHQRQQNKDLPSKSPDPIVEDETQDMNSIKALPAPPVAEEPEPPQEIPNIQREESQGDLVDLNNDPVSAEEHGDRLALALFSDTAGASGNEGSQANNGSVIGERPLAGWELALVESTSDISKPSTNTLSGGFNNLLLTSMYDQGAVNQKVAASVPSGSASSVVLPGRPASSYLALPSPVGAQLDEDPFAASLSVPPPSYVQMSDLQQKQGLLVKEQQMWYSYQRDGMQGYNGLMKYQNPTYSGSVPFYQPVPYYGSAYH